MLPIAVSSFLGWPRRVNAPAIARVVVHDATTDVPEYDPDDTIRGSGLDVVGPVFVDYGQSPGFYADLAMALGVAVVACRSERQILALAAVQPPTLTTRCTACGCMADHHPDCTTTRDWVRAVEVTQ